MLCMLKWDIFGCYFAARLVAVQFCDLYRYYAVYK